VVVEYGYDDSSRLTGLTYKLSGTAFGSLTYGYDAGGQRTSVSGSYARSSLPAALASATYDDANQIATFGGTTFTYDANGNLTFDGTRSYSWNHRNELTGITGGVSASFAYDALGRRRTKTVSGTARGYLYDRLTPVQELASGTPTANLLTGLNLDEYFTRTDGSGSTNLLPDALGSTLALTDTAGAVQTEYTYEPFGGTLVTGASTGNTLGFTGREADVAGLNFHRLRYYDTRLQRFNSEDPIGFRGGTNLFAYVRNVPTGPVDPMGLKPRRPYGGGPGGPGGPGSGDPGAGDPGGDPNGNPGGDPNSDPEKPPDPLRCGTELGQQNGVPQSTPVREDGALTVGSVMAGQAMSYMMPGAGNAFNTGTAVLEAGPGTTGVIVSAIQRRNQIEAVCGMGNVGCQASPVPVTPGCFK
jgi:RHS repeat-associated protein